MADEVDLKGLLKKAVMCDKKGRLFEAESLYKEGMNMLLEVVDDSNDIIRKKILYDRIAQYMLRTEQISERLAKQTSRGNRVTTLNVSENSVGNSYQTLFEDYLNADVREVVIEEPNLSTPTHFQNLVIFLETMLKSCPNLKYLRLLTKPAPQKANQTKALQEIQKQIEDHNITCHIRIEDSVNNSRIIIGNGFIIKTNYGLHFYKDHSYRYPLGLGDYDYRKCLPAEIDIWRTQLP